MALDLVRKNLDGLPADVAKEYKKGPDDLFYLETTPYDDGKRRIATEDVMGLRKALDDERGTVHALRSQLSQFNGIDPVKAREALAQVEALANGQADEKTEAILAARLKPLKEKLENDIREAQERNAALTRDLEQSLLIARSDAAIVAAGADPELLGPHIRPYLRMKQGADKRHYVEVFDPKTGNPMGSRKPGSTDPMQIDELIATFKAHPKFSKLFPASGESGTGVGDGTGKGGTNNSNNGGGGGDGKKEPIKIKSSDQAALNANWEKIATGEAVVVD